jgi:hypothetical protein
MLNSSNLSDSSNEAQQPVPGVQSISQPDLPEKLAASSAKSMQAAEDAQVQEKIQAALAMMRQASRSIESVPPGHSPTVVAPPSEELPADADALYQQLFEKFRNDPAVQTIYEESRNQVFSKYPLINNDKGRFFVEKYAQYLDETLPGHIGFQQVLEMAAHEIAGFLNESHGMGPSGSAPATAGGEKRKAFAEGSGNRVPPGDPYQSALKQAQKTGNVDELIRLKLKKLNKET